MTLLQAYHKSRFQNAAQLARAAGVHPNTVYRALAGTQEPTPSTENALRAALGLPGVAAPEKTAAPVRSLYATYLASPYARRGAGGIVALARAAGLYPGTVRRAFHGATSPRQETLNALRRVLL